MKNQIIKCGLMAVTFLLGSTVVHAACPQSNLAGTWEVFITETNGVLNSWQSCSLNLASNGNINSGTCVSSDGTESSVAGVKITSSGNCAVAGSIVIDADTYTIADGQINRNKFDMSGVGTTTLGIFSFTAVKR